MATTFNTPGVYIQEIPKLPASVAQVETAIPAFMGYTMQAKSNPGLSVDDLVKVPTRITSMLEFESIFGGPFVAFSVNGSTGSIVYTKDKLDSAGHVIPISPVPASGPVNVQVSAIDTSYKLYYSLQFYFANGGGPCYIISTGVTTTDATTHVITYPTIEASDFTDALAVLKKEDEPTLIVATDAVNLTESQYYSVITSALDQCNSLQDRFTIVDVWGLVSSTTNTIGLRNLIGVNNLKYGAAYYPNLLTTLNYAYSAVSFDNSVAALSGMLVSDALKSTDTTVLAALNKVIAAVKANITAFGLILPPSAAVAGVYASVDNARGVWKAPANVSVNNVIAPTLKINDEDQAGLNVDTIGGKSVNVIRSFTGKGTLIWGSRTLAGNDNEWKYVNVRRLFITAEESIKKATSFIVFESNDANTWIRVKTMIENYLTGLWRDGALAGATPQEAFFVNVGLGTTMTAQDILEGRLNIEVGMAAVRPAEFIVLSFSHKLQTS